jgi:hypothetical protein
MAKITVIRSNKKFTLYKRVARRKGRGSKFQWNAKSQYVITYTTEEYKGKPGKVFNTFEDADKEWVYLTLRHS